MKKTSLSSSKNFIPLSSPVFLLYAPLNILQVFSCSCEAFKRNIFIPRIQNSSVRKASGHVVDLRSKFCRDNRPSEFCYLSVPSVGYIALYPVIASVLIEVHESTSSLLESQSTRGSKIFGNGQEQPYLKLCLLKASYEQVSNRHYFIF